MFQADFLPSRAAELLALTALKTRYIADGYIAKAFQAGFNPTRLNVAADFAAHECNYTGYASKTFGGAGHLFTANFVDSQGRAVFATPTELFQATDAVAPNQIGGMWVENTAGAVLDFVKFPVPVDFTFALAAMLPCFFESASGQGYAEVDN
jgi:hypothetical protein